MTQRRRSTSRPPSTRRSGRQASRSRSGSASGSTGRGLPLPKISLGLSPAVVRSLVGLTLLVLGAVLLIAIALQGQGKLTDAVRDVIAPYFGTGRFLLPFLLLLAGWYLEWGPGKEPEAPWLRTLLGLALAFCGLLGILQVLGLRGEFTGGHIGRFLAGNLEPLITTPGAFVLLLAACIGGLLIAFDMPLRALLSPATRAARAAGTSLQSQAGKTGSAEPAARSGSADATAATAVAAVTGRRSRAGTIPNTEAPGQTGVWGADVPGTTIPAAVPSVSQVSSTFAPAKVAGSAGLVVGAATGTAAGGVRGEPGGMSRRRRHGTRRPHRFDGRAAHPGANRLAAAADGAARGGRGAGLVRERRCVPRAQRGDHRPQARLVRHRGADRRPQRGPGRHPVRGPARAAHQAQPDRGAVATTSRWRSRPAACGSRRRSRARPRSVSRSPTRSSRSSRCGRSSRSWTSPRQAPGSRSPSGVTSATGRWPWTWAGCPTC